MAAVMIGVDPRKGSHTAVVIGAAEEVLGQLRVRACAAQAQQLLGWAAAWPQRTWADAGFTVVRREHDYLVPTAPDRTMLAGAVLPAGMSLVSADAVDEDGLRLLDEALRQDVPGSDGWINDPGEFREYTFDEGHFDPATYLVAVDDAGQAYAGLARVWNTQGRPRLGLIGVTRGYHRQGLAKVLLAAVLTPLRERGIGEVAAEADEANTASNTLLAKFGARRVGGSVELVRRAPR
jgi:RimJ/RimL family protein N-acetyltransferase